MELTLKIEKWLDNSKMGAFERCPREFFLRYVLHLQKPQEKGQIALLFGKAFHIGCEEFFKARNSGLSPEKSLEVSISKAIEEFQTFLSQFSIENPQSEELLEDPRADVDFLARTLSFFFTAGTGKELSDMTRRALTELLIEWKPQNSEWKLLGRVDLIIETLSQSTILIDFKTTRYSISRNWSEKSQTDVQLSTYCLLALKVLVVQKIDAVAYAVVQADRRRLKNGRWSPTITLKSELFPLAMTQDHIERAEYRFSRIVNSVDTSAQDPKPQSFPPVFGSCQRLKGICQFFPLCELTWKSQTWDDVLEIAERLGYIQSRWHPFEDV